MARIYDFRFSIGYPAAPSSERTPGFLAAVQSQHISALEIQTTLTTVDEPFRFSRAEVYLLVSNSPLVLFFHSFFTNLSCGSTIFCRHFRLHAELSLYILLVSSK